MDPDPKPEASGHAEEYSTSTQRLAHRNISTWFKQRPSEENYSANKPHQPGHVTNSPSFESLFAEDAQVASPSHQAKTDPTFAHATLSGPETLAQLRKRHDELAEEMKIIKRRINLRELIEKEKELMHEKELERERELEAKQKREREEIEKMKEPETGAAEDGEMDVDIDIDIDY